MFATTGGFKPPNANEEPTGRGHSIVKRCSWVPAHATMVTLIAGSNWRIFLEKLLGAVNSCTESQYSKAIGVPEPLSMVRILLLEVNGHLLILKFKLSTMKNSD